MSKTNHLPNTFTSLILAALLFFVFLTEIHLRLEQVCIRCRSARTGSEREAVSAHSHGSEKGEGGEIINWSCCFNYSLRGKVVDYGNEATYAAACRKEADMKSLTLTVHLKPIGHAPSIGHARASAAPTEGVIVTRSFSESSKAPQHERQKYTL